MTQIRQTNTKKDIKIALTKLLLEQDFESISVSQLSREAKINRGTFYLHYLDKYDLIEQLKEDTITDLLAILNDQSRTYPVILEETFLYLQESFDFIRSVSNSSYINFSDTVKEFITKVLEDNPTVFQAILVSYTIPREYALAAYLASLESIISYWIQTGGKESPQVMTQMILELPRPDCWK